MFHTARYGDKFSEFMAEVRGGLNEWEEAHRKLEALQQPYNDAVGRLREEQKNRVTKTAATGILAELEDITSVEGEIRTLEAARVGLERERDFAMRMVRGLVMDGTAAATV